MTAIVRSTPLQNRVDPFGRLFADSSRGLFFGNRGGRFHRDDQTLGARRHVSRRWICCVLQFRGRHRRVWGNSYTELFFLDEPTALAAGHRPCFECRRADAKTFAALWAKSKRKAHSPTADEMDDVLQAERWPAEGRAVSRRLIDDLPDGAFVTLDGEPGVAFAVRGDRLLRWTPAGYADARPRRRGTSVSVLTPLSMAGVLGAGYQPVWHPSADLI
jgi:hypothetical protein